MTRLRVNRFFTSASCDPYSTVEWERSDVVMRNWRDGEINFEQRGVEFPTSWSVNARQIVASKYFRGQLGTSGRESSLRQLIDRVVDTYTMHGHSFGYFATDEDAAAFQDELKYMLVHQMFAFNSPVWFNIGTSAPQQVSACFLLSVDDDMKSILHWIYEEGMIFKGGSGSGANLSKIRGSRELMSSGGFASGPVSFMRGADASAGAIKSGGSTRRAAKLVCLDVDHPDIFDFVRLKSEEERKIKALRDAGFDMALDGKDTYSVQYQNANNSVRLSDEFLRAVEAGSQFALRNRLDGSVAEWVDARELFHAIAQCSWECADPGVQYDDTINSWNTCPESGRITTSNPCSEYMHLDNSSCNLASLNLLRFMTDDGGFRTDAFVHAVELVITAMDISVSFADFPTEKITEVSRAYRQLGIGFCNLGALLMSLGKAYDSEGGRALAGAITSLMSAVSWRRSSELAEFLGSYDGYELNEIPHLNVIERHRQLARSAHSAAQEPLAQDIFQTSLAEWAMASMRASSTGYRNAQVSLIAPTGTISFMMDADTTGIEPEFALVKMKRMVGGSETQIVNQSVERALQTLGYSPSEIVPIEEWILEHGHAAEAPGLDPQHFAVFDCAVGERSISPTGHLMMMAAAQPFLCGAISKTINLPESATVADIEAAHMAGWRLGLKSIAVYRDNCKAAQPLSTKKKEVKHEIIPTRHKLPHRRPSVTTSVHVGESEAYLTASRYPDNGLGEIFLKMGKQGSTLAGVLDAFSIAISIALQYGVPLETYVAKFQGLQFEPRGMTNDPELRLTTSIIDYVFRRLALDYLEPDVRRAMGIYSSEERMTVAEETAEASAPERHLEIDSPLCVSCGIHMTRAGVCFVCSSCGTPSGCS
jgi:ribonucleoside-diphosphate reductase alpha chain